MCWLGPDATVDSLRKVVPALLEALQRSKHLKGAVFIMGETAFANELKFTRPDEAKQCALTCFESSSCSSQSHHRPHHESSYSFQHFSPPIRHYSIYQEIEKYLDDMPYPVSVCRTGLIMEQFFFQAKDSMKEKRELPYLDCSMSLVCLRSSSVNLDRTQLELTSLR